MSSKRDKKVKAQKKVQNNQKNSQKKELSTTEIQQGLEKLFDPKKLTVPKTINHDIKEFCKTISYFEPFFIQIEPEPWCRQSCCDLNVQEYIKLNGGEMVSGYKLWYNKPNYIEAERHAIWFDGNEYKDITFNADGEETILFLPDVPEKQNNLEDNKQRIRWGKDSKTKQLISAQTQMEKMIPMEQMSKEDSWSNMLTYENWQKGQRMSNMQFI